MGEPVRRCCFTEALGRRVAGCAKAQKSVRQYRRTAHCRDSEAYDRCAAWLDHVRGAARFVLGAPRNPAALPRSLARQLQCGGLQGLADTLEGIEVKRVEDVSRLLPRAISRYGTLEKVPMEAVIRRIQEWGSGDD